jgi:Mrp family chromosome partitioning ATPase
MRPRYRFSDETESDVAGQTPLLGILPQLPDRPVDSDQTAGAAQCVHQMRVMLQVAARGKKCRYLVTSGHASEGKTSITLSLGLSYAAAGSRTLLIDADMVGRQLTHGFNAELEEGLSEALATGTAEPYIRQTSPGLWLLPVGRRNHLHASKLAAPAMQALLDDLHQSFDVILIDSGPILGSVEASIIAPMTDGAIVVVARGQSPVLLDKCIQHVRATGAKPVGMIFNRAQLRDFYRSSYGSSIRPTSVREIVAKVMSVESDGLLRFGPLVQAVLSSLPAADNGDTFDDFTPPRTKALIG